MEFSRSINKLAKLGMVLSILVVCVIGGGMIYLSNTSYTTDFYMLRLGLIIIGFGIIASVLSWGILGVISEIGIEAQRIRELLEQNVIDSMKNKNQNPT